MYISSGQCDVWWEPAAWAVMTFLNLSFSFKLCFYLLTNWTVMIEMREREYWKIFVLNYFIWKCCIALMTGFAGIRLIAANLILSVFASDFINQALNLIFIIIRFQSSTAIMVLLQHYFRFYFLILCNLIENLSISEKLSSFVFYG